MNPASLEQFLSACGSSEPLRLSVAMRDDQASEIWSFRQPFLVIGRRPESDLVIDHWQVSRRHAYLQLIEGRYYCVDLGSRTGTHGGDSAERAGWIERGRVVQIGPYAVRPEWPQSSPTPPGLLPAVTWELPGRALGGAVWRMDRHLALIGRSLSCRIRIVEPDVSKFHCSVVLTPVGVWAVDLLGQSGIFVNDEPVRCARLEDGDSLRIGRHTLRARYETPPKALPAPSPRADAVSDPGTPGPSSPPATFDPVFPAWGARPFDELPVRFSPEVGQGLAHQVPPGMPGLPGGVVDPSVNLLIHQFSLMQQQMFDQFHRTMLMMFEGFAAMHREQSASIREEFDRVRQLSEEIESLRRETARLADLVTSRPSPPPSPGPPRPPHASGVSPPNSRPIGPHPIRPPLAPPSDPEIDIHAKLCLRLASIESERQTRWQKILGMMSSRS